MSLRPLIACLLVAPLMAGGCDRQSQERGQATPTLDTAAANEVAATTPDEVTSNATASSATAMPASALDRSHKGEAMSAVSFVNPSNAPVLLATFRGKPLLLNLWATWCAPCVAEMPTLDALARRDAGKLQVVAVSQDLDGAAKVAPFFRKNAFKALQPYLDPKLALSVAFQANLPTTILYDSSGREVWRMVGGYDWTSGPARALIAEAN